MKSKGKSKKANIPLRRKIIIIYMRSLMVLKLLALSLLILFCFTNYFAPIKLKGADWMYNSLAEQGFKTKEIIIQGDNNLSKDTILSSLNIPEDYPIFKLNLKNLHSTLLNNIWIKDLIIKRKLPATIQIEIVEKMPIAIWQINKQLFLIDENGSKITKEFDHNKFERLLHIVGPGANICATGLLKNLSKSPELTNKLVSVVRNGERRWDLNFIQNITVQMPEDNFNDAFDYLINLNQSNKLFDQNYKILDLRNPNKYHIEYYNNP